MPMHWLGSLMKILMLDIETSPLTAHTWGIWQQNIGINQLLAATEMICFAAKWHGKKKIEFYSVHKDGKQAMVEQAHRLLNEADVLMHYNGARFDVPHLNREFVQAGLLPPSPYKQVDLMRAVKKRFYFPSNKLEYVARALGVGGKVSHTGFELWLGCMAGDEKSWKLMEKYNKQDVQLLEELHSVLLPWIPGYPNAALYNDTDGHVCPACGSGENLKRDGLAYLTTGRYQRYHCACGKYSRATRRVDGVEIVGVAG